MTGARGAGRWNAGWVYRDRVPGDAAGLPIADFYAQRFPHSSATVWRQRLAAGLIRLDGAVACGAERLQTGQRLEYRRPPWREAPVPLAFAVLYEDAHLIAVAKPSGLPTMPGGTFLVSTLLHRLRRRYPDHPAPLHRLGRATSGIVLFARSRMARQELSAALRTGGLRKEYRALAQGTAMPDTFVVTEPVGPVPYQPLGTVHAVSPTGKAARTECKVLERRPADGAALLRVVIPTGRAHQIRIHLAAAGWPLQGDPLYAPGGSPRPPLPGQRAALPGDGGYWLHAHRVVLTHPVHGERLTLTCMPPPALRQQEALAGTPG